MKGRIVLIEDNHEMRENIAEILELADYEVHEAPNGKEGVSLIQKHMPNLIICDVMMPELDGYGVLKIISNDTRTSHIPFIFLTAKSEKSDFRKGMNLGADDYLTKPFDDLDLLDAVETRLKKAQKEAQAQPGGEEAGKKFTIEDLEKLPDDKESKIYRKKEIVYTEGKYPRYLFFLRYGKVKTFKVNEDGKEYITNIFKAGDYFGYNALLKSSKYLESATALEESEIVVIPSDEFMEMVYSSREIADRFIKLLASDLDEAEIRLINLAYDSVRKRVADSLLLLHRKYIGDDDVETVEITILRDDLASIVGTAKESVIRTLSDLKEEGLIAIEGSKITLLDLDGLRDLIG